MRGLGSRPVRIGLNPAPSAIRAPILPRMVILPESGLINPLSIFKSVVFPAPLCPMSPRHSPRRNSKDTSCTAQNSSLRRSSSRAAAGEKSEPRLGETASGQTLTF